MVLPEQERADLVIIKEFWPRDPDSVTSAGRLIIRATNYGSELERFDAFYDILADDAATFNPPIVLGRGDVEIVHYGGEHYSGTFGLEASIPEGHIVNDNYTRIANTELTSRPLRLPR